MTELVESLDLLEASLHRARKGDAGFLIQPLKVRLCRRGFIRDGGLQLREVLAIQRIAVA